MSWIKYSKKNKIPTELEQHLESTNGGRCAFLASVYGYYAYSRASRLKCHESSTLLQAYQRYGLAPSKLLPAKKNVKSPAPDRSIPFNHQKNTVCVGTFLFPPGHFAGSSSFIDRSLFAFFCQRPVLLIRKAAVLPVEVAGSTPARKPVHTIQDFQVKKPWHTLSQVGTVLKGPPQRFCWQVI